MDENYKERLVQAGKRMLHSGLTVETWGNISLRDPHSGRIYLTPSGMDYDRCTPEDMVVFDLEGNLLEGMRKPTCEWELHLRIYRERPEVNAVLHTHPIDSLVFACLREEIPLIIDEAAQALGDVVRVAQYALPGTPELAENCIAALGRRANACLLQSHGAVCVGDSIDRAFRVATVLEMTAKVYYMARTIGTPVPIAPEHIEIMKGYVNTYGQGR